MLPGLLGGYVRRFHLVDTSVKPTLLPPPAPGSRAVPVGRVLPPPPPGASARPVLVPPALSSLATTTAEELSLGGSGALLSSTSGDDTRRLLGERDTLTARLAELDAAAEQLSRSVQRVGGAMLTSRRFSGAPPLTVDSPAHLQQQISSLTAEMQALTATISEQELKLHELDRPERRQRTVRVALILLVVAAAAAAAIFLAVR